MYEKIALYLTNLGKCWGVHGKRFDKVLVLQRNTRDSITCRLLEMSVKGTGLWVHKKGIQSGWGMLLVVDEEEVLNLAK